MYNHKCISVLFIEFRFIFSRFILFIILIFNVRYNNRNDKYLYLVHTLFYCIKLDR